jgi:hypothetical protein
VSFCFEGSRAKWNAKPRLQHSIDFPTEHFWSGEKEQANQLILIFFSLSGSHFVVKETKAKPRGRAKFHARIRHLDRLSRSSETHEGLRVSRDRTFLSL